MPNTTNFNWPTPADTDLVKDGAAAIRNLGNGIDTSLIDLKGGTTGQILSKASNADMDFTFITPNVGDITEVQAGTGISVASGTGPIPVITNTVATAFDAAGDLVYGTGADTFTKLSLGTAGQVLKVNSGATAPEWGAAGSASALTYITGATFTTSSAISFPNDTFTATYNNYKIVFVLTSASANSQIRIRLRASGSDDSNATYYSGGTEVDSGGTETLTNVNNGTNFVWGTIKNANYPANFFDMTVYEPKVGSPTRISALGGVGGQGYAIVGGYFNANTSFDSMTIYPSTGTLTGNYRVYGLANS